MKLFCKVMFFLVAFPLISEAKPAVSQEVSKPSWNDWLCWVVSKQDKSCIVYGYSKNKKVSIAKANDLCEKHCESECEFQYCEFLFNR